MKPVLLTALLVVVFISGCSLAGDITPPPALATAQANRSLPAVTTLPHQNELQPTSSPTVNLSPLSGRPDLDEGGRIYAEMCAPCHGSTGLGDGTDALSLGIQPSPLGDFVFARQAKLTDWYEVVTLGRMERFMPPFSSLSDIERWNVAAYALTLSIDSEIANQGELIFVEECSECHGEDGSGNPPIPALNDSAYLADRSAVEVFNSISIGVETMPAYEETLSEGDRWVLARYVQRLAFGVNPDAGGTEATSLEKAGLGTIQGQAINGTSGGSVPTDLEVMLMAVDGQAITFTTTSELDETGKFVFGQLEIYPERIYFVYVDYLEIRYAADIGILTEDETAIDLPLTIYETTADMTSVVVDQMHIIFNFFGDGVVEVTEVWLLSSTGDRTVATAGGLGFLEIPLPRGFVDLRFNDDRALESRYQKTDWGFIDHAPIRPDQPVELVFSFTLPFAPRLDFNQPLTTAVDAVVILTSEGAPKVEADGLEDLGLRDVGGVLMHRYEFGALSSGDFVRLNLSAGLPSVGGVSSLTNVAIGMGALFVALGIVGLWWYRKGTGRGVGKADSEVAGANRERLLRAIAALDDDFEEGRIPEGEYRRRREELKRRALVLMRGDDD